MIAPEADHRYFFGMQRYVAFLRAINVGGHTVTKDRLIAVFESLGLTAVETFIASGNVIFSVGKASRPTLEKKIAGALEKSLRYEVATFLRTNEEIAEILKAQPFSRKMFSTAAAYNIGFLHNSLNSEQQKKLVAFRNEIDELTAVGREVHWLCRKKQSESTFNGGKLERALGLKVTFRSHSSLSKLATKLGLD